MSNDRSDVCYNIGIWNKNIQGLYEDYGKTLLKALELMERVIFMDGKSQWSKDVKSPPNQVLILNQYLKITMEYFSEINTYMQKFIW